MSSVCRDGPDLFHGEYVKNDIAELELYFYGMGEQRTRFPSTSEVVYRVPPDMSMLCYFILWRGDAVVKGIKRRRQRATARDWSTQIFASITFLRNTHYLCGTLSGICFSHTLMSTGSESVLTTRRSNNPLYESTKTQERFKFDRTLPNWMPSAAIESLLALAVSPTDIPFY